MIFNLSHNRYLARIKLASVFIKKLVGVESELTMEEVSKVRNLMLASFWKKTGPIIKELRESINQPHFGQGFEYLATKLIERERARV